ncbi:hypothetical protein, unlikely [Trypanosoma congolense IL3000]|uniref:Uncharacterized protein n=1 Tax=Trypanosoma congolense (strain IL3000) TaxID=1068625 RepID=F9WAB0_TRYCI|nr:hypothetical protein, unlikely [Trypanosoma congolense IL3000]
MGVPIARETESLLEEVRNFLQKINQPMSRLSPKIIRATALAFKYSERLGEFITVFASARGRTAILERAHERCKDDEDSPAATAVLQDCFPEGATFEMGNTTGSKFLYEWPMEGNRFGPLSSKIPLTMPYLNMGSERHWT